MTYITMTLNNTRQWQYNLSSGGSGLGMWCNFVMTQYDCLITTKPTMFLLLVCLLELGIEIHAECVVFVITKPPDRSSSKENDHWVCRSNGFSDNSYLHQPIYYIMIVKILPPVLDQTPLQSLGSFVIYGCDIVQCRLFQLPEVTS